MFTLVVFTLTALESLSDGYATRQSQGTAARQHQNILVIVDQPSFIVTSLEVVLYYEQAT